MALARRIGAAAAIQGDPMADHQGRMEVLDPTGLVLAARATGQGPTAGPQALNTAAHQALMGVLQDPTAQAQATVRQLQDPTEGRRDRMEGQGHMAAPQDLTAVRQATEGDLQDLTEGHLVPAALVVQAGAQAAAVAVAVAVAALRATVVAVRPVTSRPTLTSLFPSTNSRLDALEFCMS